MTQHSYTNQEAHDKLGRVKANLILTQPFFASIICSLPFIEDKTLPMPTLCTNGQWIKYDPDFIEGLDFDECTAALAHEVGHIMFQHMFRRGARDPQLWNSAGDYIINNMIEEAGVGRLGKGWLHDPSVVAAGEGTTDGVYAVLDQNQRDKGGKAGDKSGPQSHDNCEDFEGTAAEQAEAEAKTKIMVTQAQAVAKMAGKLPAAVARFIEEALKPKVDWKAVLRNFMEARAKIDRSYARPARRFVGMDLYLPHVTGNQMGEIAIAIDCSGSIADKELSEFLTEVQAIKEDLKPVRTHLIYFHHEVDAVDTFEQDEDIVRRKPGSGGTAFSPIFDHIANSEMDPVCCVVLTDLHCSDFGPAPDYPVMWVTTGAEKAPWGSIVTMNNNR